MKAIWLDALIAKGFTASGYIRALLERELDVVAYSPGLGQGTPVGFANTATRDRTFPVTATLKKPMVNEELGFDLHKGRGVLSESAVNPFPFRHQW